MKPSDHIAQHLKEVRESPLASVSTTFRGRARGKYLHLKRMRRRTLLRKAMHLISPQAIVWSIPQFMGDFEIAPNSELAIMLLEDRFEKDLTSFLTTILDSGDHFVDIGANVGLYTILAAKLVGSSGMVLSAEPAPSAFASLERNVFRNAVNNVTLYNGVVTSNPGAFVFNVVEESPEYSSLGPISHPHAPSTVRAVHVPGETLDNLVLSQALRPNIVKIDVEGAEGLVLSGADAVLRSIRPCIISEIDDRLLKQQAWSSGEVIALLEAYGYRIFDAPSGVELTALSVTTPFIGEIIALPSE